jgi:hypothetical protein
LTDQSHELTAEVFGPGDYGITHLVETASACAVSSEDAVRSRHLKLGSHSLRFGALHKEPVEGLGSMKPSSSVGDPDVAETRSH